MASHHHLCHPSAPAPVPPASACNCHCCYGAYNPYTPCHHPPPPTQPTLHHPHFHPDPLNLPNPPHFRELHLDRSFPEQRPTFAAVSSLLRRISALESALRRRSPAPSASSHLRDAAARTIQTHFRAFLCRRSRTLRQLKDLAAIKSTLGALKTLICKNTQFDYDFVYRKTVNLLLKLDAIQGDDPMIRTGKSSLATELNKFLVLIDGIGLKVKFKGDDLKSRVSNIEVKLGNLKFGGSKGDNVEKLRALVERIDKLAEEIDAEEGEVIKIPNQFSMRKDGVLVRRNGGARPKVKKTVSFVEDAKVYSRRAQEALLEGYCDEGIDGSNVVHGVREIEDDLGQEIDELGGSSKEAEDEDQDEVEDEDEEVHLDKEGSFVASDVEKGLRSFPMGNGSGGRRRLVDDEMDGFVFRPPLPVKMETRGVSIDRRTKRPE